MSAEAKKTEKKDDGAKKDEVKKEVQPKKKPEPRGGIEDLRRIVAMIERAVDTNQVCWVFVVAKSTLLSSSYVATHINFFHLLFFSIHCAYSHRPQPRLIGRALRHNGPLRQQASKEVLTEAVTFYVPEGVARMQLTEQIFLLPDSPVVASPPAMDVKDDAEDVKEPEKETKEPAPPRTSIIPEVETYISLLVLTTLLRQGEPLAAQALAAAQQLVLSCGQHNRRSLDSLRAKAFSYLGLAHERASASSSSTVASTPSLRPMLLAAHRTACLQHDEMGQATLLNLLLRSLLEENQVEQAFKLVSKTNFPEKASNNQFCRYLYYTGRIAALQVSMNLF
jgi:26S proteasome regulatory subunit N3